MPEFYFLRPSLLSTRCELCGDVGYFSSCVCDPCLSDLPRLKDHCSRCGMVLPQYADTCGNCITTIWYADLTICPFQYHYPLDRLIQKIKYQDCLRLVSPLTKKLVSCLTQNTLPEALIPVPLHPYRLYSRGFNQSVEICKILNDCLGIKVITDLIVRTRNTKPMFELGAKQRSRNIRDAFRLTRPLGYRSVAIVDDVITSGATANELALLLKQAGASRIEFWALARSG